MFGWFEKLVDPFPTTPAPQPPAGFFAFVWSSTRGMRRLILVLILLTAAIGAFEALLFSMLGSVVDWLSAVPADQWWTTQKSKLLMLAGILLASPLLIALQGMSKYQGLSSNFPMRLRWNFHRHLLAQSLSFYQDEFAGRVSAKLMQTALAVRDCVLIVTDILVFITIYFVTMLGVVGSFDATLLLPFLGWLACYVLALTFFVPRLGKAAAAQADARSLMTGRVTDAYTNISTVKLFSHSQREAGFASSAMKDFLATAYRQMRLISGFEIVNHALSMGLIAATAGMTLWLWTQGQVGIGAVAAATAMALRLNGISHWIMWEMASLFENIGTVQDGITTLARPIEIRDAPDAQPLTVSRGELRFEQVNFSYGGKKPVLHDLTLQIHPGEKIGVVGRSGAGKSTLLNLLLRFYDIDSGRVLIDGQDIARVTQDSLRAQVGMVTQDTSLLHRSVRDNLMYGRPDATEAAMRAAAERAEAVDFIDGLTDAKGRKAYDAHVGERGVKLSGGQRQRIAIARVMLKDAPILLLDEATSALDSEVESAIQRSLYRLMEGKTVVAIAHRLSTIAAMDRLIVMDQGRIVEQGDHASLLAQGGLYAKLWAHQSGGFLVEDELDAASPGSDLDPDAVDAASPATHRAAAGDRPPRSGEHHDTDRDIVHADRD
ncbi:ABC transporter ATP-binding protein [Roseateles amylovorans]|uniref:ABC transporter ATP-binding protein/permease n=1 Tax=Roseateles amylovorans TaxID=2978473 RepID=A0ABY6B698_9BURK|nr:ABC transporter ATP-binding protein [Roseateles amylovorans]UXH78755.1 ABC transporter ATP-binding protein/permease [Roseateles amylovorans]